MNILNKIKYAFIDKKEIIISVCVGFIILLAAIYFLNYSNFINDLFAPILDPWMGIGTFLMAIIIGIQNRVVAWENSLPKKLTVHFKIEDEEGNFSYLFSCYETYLLGEGDIRAWGQQIGMQMNNNNPLQFYLYINQLCSKDKLYQIKKNNTIYKLYEVEFFVKNVGFAPLNYKARLDNDSHISRFKEVTISKTLTEKIDIKDLKKLYEYKKNRGLEVIEYDDIKKILNITHEKTS